MKYESVTDDHHKGEPNLSSLLCHSCENLSRMDFGFTHCSVHYLSIAWPPLPDSSRTPRVYPS